MLDALLHLLQVCFVRLSCAGVTVLCQRSAFHPPLAGAPLEKGQTSNLGWEGARHSAVMGSLVSRLGHGRVVLVAETGDPGDGLVSGLETGPDMENAPCSRHCSLRLVTPQCFSAPGEFSCLRHHSAAPCSSRGRAPVWHQHRQPRSGGEAMGEAPRELCVHSLRRGSSGFRPLQKELSISSLSSLHVGFSTFVLWLSLIGEDSEVHLEVQKINMLSPLNFQNPATGF